MDSSDDEVVWGPLTVPEIKKDLKNPKSISRRHTFNLPKPTMDEYLSLNAKKNELKCDVYDTERNKSDKVDIWALDSDVSKIENFQQTLVDTTVVLCDSDDSVVEIKNVSVIEVEDSSDEQNNSERNLSSASFVLGEKSSVVSEDLLNSSYFNKRLNLYDHKFNDKPDGKSDDEFDYILEDECDDKANDRFDEELDGEFDDAIAQNSDGEFEDKSNDVYEEYDSIEDLECTMDVVEKLLKRNEELQKKKSASQAVADEMLSYQNDNDSTHNLLSVEDMEDDYTPMKNVRPTAEHVHTPKKIVYSPMQHVHVPVINVHTPKKTVHSPKKNDRAPMTNTHTPKKNILSPIEYVYTPRKIVHSPVERVHMPVKNVRSPIEHVHTPKKNVARSPAERVHTAKKNVVHSPVQHVYTPAKTVCKPVQQIRVPNRNYYTPVKNTPETGNKGKAVKSVNSKIPKPNVLLEPNQQKKTPAEDFKMPDKPVRGRALSPIPKSPTLQPFKHIISPVAYYIKNAPQTPLLRKEALIPTPNKKVTPTTPKRAQGQNKENKNLPSVKYAPAKKTEYTQIGEIKLPNSVQALVPHKIYIKKHGPRVKGDEDVVHERVFDDTNVDMSEVQESPKDVSVVEVKRAYIK